MAKKNNDLKKIYYYYKTTNGICEFFSIETKELLYSFPHKEMEKYLTSFVLEMRAKGFEPVLNLDYKE